MVASGDGATRGCFPLEASVRRRWRESSKRSSASVRGGVPFRTSSGASGRPEGRSDRAGDRPRRSLSRASFAGNQRRRGIDMSPLRSSVRRELEHESARAGSRHVAASPGGAGIRSGRRRALRTRPEQPRNRRRCGRHREHAQRQDARDACDRCAVPRGLAVWVGWQERRYGGRWNDHSTSARVPSIIAAGRRGRRARGGCPRAPPGSRAWRRRL